MDPKEGNVLLNIPDVLMQVVYTRVLASFTVLYDEMLEHTPEAKFHLIREELPETIRNSLEYELSLASMIVEAMAGDGLIAEGPDMKTRRFQQSPDGAIRVMTSLGEPEEEG